jgi:hypothetical protein
MDDLELVRVLVEAGETATIVDWLESEARRVYDETRRVLVDPCATPGDQVRARLIRDRLGEMFAELRDLVDLNESGGR